MYTCTDYSIFLRYVLEYMRMVTIYHKDPHTSRVKDSSQSIDVLFTTINVHASTRTHASTNHSKLHKYYPNGWTEGTSAGLFWRKKKKDGKQSNENVHKILLLPVVCILLASRQVQLVNKVHLIEDHSRILKQEPAKLQLSKEVDGQY